MLKRYFRSCSQSRDLSYNQSSSNHTAIHSVNQAANHRANPYSQPYFQHMLPTVCRGRTANRRPNSYNQARNFRIQGLLEQSAKIAKIKKNKKTLSSPSRANITPPSKRKVIAAQVKNLAPLRAEFLQGVRAAPLHFRGPKIGPHSKPKVDRITR